MNPKNIILTAIILISFLSVGFSAQAVELPNPGATPDSPFYFLKTWKESIQTFFTFGLENKAKQYLHLADVRLAEYQKMIDKGNTKAAEKTLVKYERQLNRALTKAEEMKQKGKEAKNLTQKLEEAVPKHLDVLEKNLEKVPEQARQGLEKAIDNSQKQIEKIKKLNKDVSEINNFEECAEAGYQILMTAPRQCKTSDGKTFIEQATEGNEENIKDEQNAGSIEKGGKAGETGTEREKPTDQEGIISTDAKDTNESSQETITSTFGPCTSNGDCYVDEGCNPSRCQSKSDPAIALCINKDKSQPTTPKELGYDCQCAESKCQWIK